MREYTTINTGSNTRTMYEFKEQNSKGEKITVEICECEAGKQQIKMGFPKNWLSVHTYVEDSEKCYGGYNPFTERYEKGYKVVIDKLLTVSAENKIKALEMVEALAFAEV